MSLAQEMTENQLILTFTLYKRMIVFCTYPGPTSIRGVVHPFRCFYNLIALCEMG